MKCQANALVGVIVCGVAGLCASCAPVTAEQGRGGTRPVDIKLVERCAAIYLQPSAVQRLTIEVDAVEGCEPEQAAMDDLGTFLKTHTSREIDWVRKPPIARSAAMGLMPEVLAACNARGLSFDSKDDGRAYLYVLFYDGAGKGPKAYVPGLYRCAILVDMSGSRLFPAWTLRHEAGHVLGLCRDPKHGDGMHCTEEKCVMQPQGVATWSLRRAILGQNPLTPPPMEFCDLCKGELLSNQRASRLSGMGFRGPFLVRQEDGYAVGMLPTHCHLSIVESDGLWEVLLSSARTAAKSIQSEKGTCNTSFAYRCSSASDFQCILPRLRAAQKDQNPIVAATAREHEQELAAKYAAAPPASSAPSTHPAPSTGSGPATSGPGSSAGPAVVGP